MTHRPVLAAALAATLVVAGSATADVAHGNRKASAAQLSPPVIHEKFTPLPCTGSPKNRTTIAMEGCAEQQILKTDKTIDTLNREIFGKLQDNPAKARFVTGNAAWYSYRNAFCTSESDVFEGGTEAPVIAADCMAGVNAQHVKDLTAFLHDLGAH